jgi:hypothetical protein
MEAEVNPGRKSLARISACVGVPVLVRSPQSTRAPAHGSIFVQAEPKHSRVSFVKRDRDREREFRPCETPSIWNARTAA